MFLSDLSISNAICFVQQKIFITHLSTVHPSKAVILPVFLWQFKVGGI